MSVWVRTRVLDEPWYDYLGCCVACDIVWNSRTLAHCTVCHRSFASNELFDAHQKVTKKGQECKKKIHGMRLRSGVLHERVSE